MHCQAWDLASVIPARCRAVAMAAAALASLAPVSRASGIVRRPAEAIPPISSSSLVAPSPETRPALHRGTVSCLLSSSFLPAGPVFHSISGTSNTYTITSSSRCCCWKTATHALPRPAPGVQRRASRRLPTTRAMAPGAADGGGKKLGVLFVCLGNICRSPTAEAVFRDAVKKQGLEERFRIDSAGTIDYHEGNPADSRMRRAAAQRGIDITSISRPIRASDFSEFDVIMAMDSKNLSDIRSAYKVWSRNMDLPADGLDKVGLICDYCKAFDTKEVPDPYYGGPQGFELVLDLLDDACTQLLESLKSKAQA